MSDLPSPVPDAALIARAGRTAGNILALCLGVTLIVLGSAMGASMVITTWRGDDNAALTTVMATVLGSIVGGIVTRQSMSSVPPR